MSQEQLKKFGIAFLIISIGLIADQWTKFVATENLANDRAGWFQHDIVINTPAEFDGKTVGELIRHRFGDRNSKREIAEILSTVTSDGNVHMPSSKVLKKGEAVEVGYRKAVVIDPYFEFEYTRNPGAAFSFLADVDPTWRRPFFIVITVLALLVIGWILRGTPIQNRAAVAGLSLIASGAIGNLIDRVRFDYVIDFIVWKLSNANRWPTFNIADAAICVGVALMVIDMILDWKQSKTAGES